ncbi:MAG: VWA domain-containing protein [Desulfamplus sp.]|nr:VWA domain-containing protein [Desulfamplus sp.]
MKNFTESNFTSKSDRTNMLLFLIIMVSVIMISATMIPELMAWTADSQMQTDKTEQSGQEPGSEKKAPLDYQNASNAKSKTAANDSTVICKVETDRKILPAGASQNVVIKVTLDALPLDAIPATSNIKRPPVNLSVVLDRSGSMSGSKLERAKAAAIEALKRLGKNDIFSLVVYDHNVETTVPAQSAQYTEGIMAQISQIQPGGNTALFGGVSQGASEIRKNLASRYVHRMILLSDGIANVGPSTPDDLGRLGAALLKEGISVSTVGVGTDYNEDLMAKLSHNSDGNIYFVESSVDLPRIFTAELGDVLSVVARKIIITIEMLDGVKPIRIIGRDGTINNNKVELSMNQLYGGQKKYILVEAQIPESKSGQNMKIATADISYENPFSLKSVGDQGSSVITFSEDKDEVAGSANIEVVREYELNINALAREKAIKLSDEGKKEEAVQALKDSAAKLKSVGSAYKDENLMEQAAALENQAEAIDRDGMSKKSRKLLRTESYQMKTQQKSK